jgi:hypothetical protein
MTDKLMTIAKFARAAEAHLAMLKLESEGIVSMIEGEDAVAAFPAGTDSVRPVELQVRDQDLAAAQAALADVPAVQDNLVVEEGD